jgi:glycosyltransferase involved in cell wall biosynthesis
MLGHDMSLYRVVHNGVDVERFAPGDGGAVRRSLGIGEEERVVGMFAAFKPQKNHKMWIAAARRVLVRLPGTRLLFVGDVLDGGAAGSAEYKRRVGQLIDEVGLRPHCVFLGNRDAVAPLYAACDVTVLPSLHEGTPNVLLESMACGVPVVASNVSDNTYVVPNGRVGYLVPVGDGAALADRVCSLLADEDQRRAMGRAGRDWVRQEFSTAVLARRMEAVYSELLDRKRSACGRHNGGLAAS